MPTREFISYLGLSGGCVGAWALAALRVAHGAAAVATPTALALAAGAGFGPALAAVGLTAVTRSGGGAPNNQVPTRPLAPLLAGGPCLRASALSSGACALRSPPSPRQPLAMAFLLLVGNLFCAVPVTWACFLALQ